MNATTLKQRIAEMRSALTTITGFAESRTSGDSRIGDAVRQLSRNLDALEQESGEAEGMQGNAPGSAEPRSNLNAVPSALPDRALIFDRDGRCTYSNRPVAANESVSADGIRCSEYSADPLYDRDGNVAAVLSRSREIAGRRQAGEALHESEQRLAILMRNLPGMAYRCLKDPDWRLDFASEGALELTGCTPESLIGGREIHFGDLIHPNDSERVREAVYAALRGGNTFTLTYRIITPAGKEKWVLEQGAASRTPEGECIALEGFITDITERKRAEEQVIASERRFRSIFEASPIGIAYCGTGGRLLDANPAFKALFGAESRCDPGCTGIFTVLGIAGRRDALLSGETRREIVRWESKPGTLYLDIWIRPILSAEKGSVKGYLLHVQDITGQVTVREIKQQAYEQIQRNIEQFAILGDHIRHPLQVIQARADLLEDEDTSRRLAEQVQRINDIVRELDKGWIESEKIREFLRKNELATDGGGSAA